MTNIRVSAGYVVGSHVDETIVTLGPLDKSKRPVYLNDELIGFVWRGERRYSPPTYKGSRIVKYHKMVPEWHGGKDRSKAQYRRDTRQEVLRYLIAAHKAKS